MYVRFAVSIVLSLLAMYVFMFSEIDRLAHFRPALGMFWATLAMVASMGVIMILTMSHMLPSRRASVTLLVAFAVLLVLSFAAARAEWLMADDAFLRSMIPHHASAIHMCQQATISDPEIVDLCRGIVDSQSREIAQMEQIIARRAR